MKKENINKVLELLKDFYGDVGTELNYENPFQLLVATILSAQCTDRQVNKVTPVLFERYPTPEDIAKLTPEELGKIIRSCGFYKTKSKNIINTAKILVEKHDSKVPKDREVLQELPGVGRKTANVVVSNVFGQDAIAVDTHVFRVSNRLGLAKADNVLDTELQLMKKIPKDKWSGAHNWLVLHGRRICKARKPMCEECFLTPYCKFFATTNK